MSASTIARPDLAMSSWYESELIFTSAQTHDPGAGRRVAALPARVAPCRIFACGHRCGEAGLAGRARQAGRSASVEFQAVVAAADGIGLAAAPP
jgi:hypothetical protein